MNTADMRWNFDKDEGDWLVMDDSFAIIAIVQEESDVEPEDAARLLAAAPEGLSVAEFVYQALLRHPADGWRTSADGQHSLCVLRAFIASATGKSERDVQEFYEDAVAGAKACAS